MLTAEELKVAEGMESDHKFGRPIPMAVIYRRNKGRIRTLERVLDPDDDQAVGNTHTPEGRQGYVDELERRRAEQAKIEKAVRAHVKKGAK